MISLKLISLAISDWGSPNYCTTKLGWILEALHLMRVKILDSHQEEGLPHSQSYWNRQSPGIIFLNAALL